jgi:hypothetical protein
MRSRQRFGQFLRHVRASLGGLTIVTVSLTSLVTSAWASVPAVTFATPEVTTGYDFEATVVGDFTRDALPDVLAETSDYPSGPTNRLFVFAQQSDGSLGSPIALPRIRGKGYLMSMAAGRFDGDERLDLAVATSEGVEILYQRRSGLVPTTFIPLTYGTYTIVARRMPGGTGTDLVVHSPSGLYIIENLGHEKWRTRKIWKEGETSFAVGDVTGDGKRDIVIFRKFHSPHIRVLAWRPGNSYVLAGGYDPRNYPNTGEVLAIGDVTGDGRNDVVLAMADNVPLSGLDIFEGRPNGSLAPPLMIHTDDIPEAIRLTDLNGDGRQDVILLHGGYGEASILMQQEDGSLGTESVTSIPHVSHYPERSFSVQDVNADGDPDIVIGSESLVVLRQL